MEKMVIERVKSPPGLLTVRKRDLIRKGQWLQKSAEPIR